jgi:putative radical SAM enzyme (TIGR03279 family)
MALAGIDPATQAPYTATISQVQPGSPADKAGVKPGWELVQVNGVWIPDVLAYRRELEKGTARLVVRAPLLGEALTFTASWEDPGLEFSEVIFDGLKLCANKCEFCYVHQMPKGFRKSLYVMDDDFRTSFLYGSFVTLTNLSETDIQRIVDEHLSPLYVSVHTTNEDLRRDMMKWWRLKVKDEHATRIRTMLKRLEPIDLYTQMVLLPGRNDGENLTETLEFLAGHDNIIAAACVPVGLTDHRRNLPELRPFNPDEARDVLRRVHAFQKRMLQERGTRFIFPSDEFYLLADEPIPDEGYYEGFPMLENGVGMIRDFLSEALPTVLPRRLETPRKVILATGKLFAPVLERAVEPLSHVEGLSIEVRALKNRTFGEVTTVAGLLAGRDFLTQIQPAEADLLLVSPNVLKYGTETMLDERTLDDLRQELRMSVAVGGTSLSELARTILDGVGGAGGPQFGYSTHAVKESYPKS